VTTELLGQAQTIEATVQADGDARPRTEAPTPLAKSIRESAMRVRRLAVGDHGARWIEGLLRMEQPAVHFELLTPLALDGAVSRAIAAMEALSISECEAIAQRYVK
jgi:hypothetical protein